MTIAYVGFSIYMLCAVLLCYAQIFCGRLLLFFLGVSVYEFREYLSDEMFYIHSPR